MALEKEMETYRRELKNYLGSLGKFILIHGEEVIGVWEDREKALEVGYKRFGLGEPFLVKEIRVIRRGEFMPYDIFDNADNQTQTRSGRRSG